MLDGTGNEGTVDIDLEAEAAPPAGDSGEKGEMGDKEGKGGRDIMGGGREGGFNLLFCVGEYDPDEDGEGKMDVSDTAVVARRVFGDEEILLYECCGCCCCC